MTNRIYYLDALRSFCMLFGILVHTNTLFDPSLYPIVNGISQHFRMPTFFLVSGFFVALVTHRTSATAMFRRRTLAIMLPFLSALILLNPVTNYLVHIYHNPWMSPVEFFSGGWRAPAEGPGVWLLHLWFLLSLWFYVAISPALGFVFNLAPAKRLAGRLAGWRPDVLIFALALAVAIGVMALRGFYAVILEPAIEGSRLAWTARATLQNLPYFMLGIAAYATPALFERLHRVSWPTLVLGLVLVLGLDRLGGALPDAAGTLAEIFARALLTVANIAALLWISRALFSKANGFVAALTDSIYTVYLFHYLAIYVWGNLLAGDVTSDPLLYFVVTALTFLSTFALHRWVIARTPILTLMFNGRPMPRSRTQRLHEA